MVPYFPTLVVSGEHNHVSSGAACSDDEAPVNDGVLDDGVASYTLLTHLRAVRGVGWTARGLG
jgi:hypothetical protein